MLYLNLFLVYSFLYPIRCNTKVAYLLNKTNYLYTNLHPRFIINGLQIIELIQL